jgi:UDP-N-acetyl-2-amino-2-deoxyglucuronate dehydrogenase
MIRFGIIGCGAIAPTHAEALQKIYSVELVGAFDVLPERTQKLAEKYGITPYATRQSLFKAVDAVIIGVPSGFHAQVARQAIAAGKHVVAEKPIEVNLPKAQALVAAARAADVRFTVISQHRFARQVRRLRDAAISGELGPLLAGDASIKWYRTQQYYDSGDWRGTRKLDGGGCLINQGVHYIDMIQWIMGGVHSVQAQVRTAAHQIEVEDIANVLVEYKNGAVGVIQGSTSYYPGFAERLEVHGEHGSVIVEGDRIKLWRVDAERAKLGKYGDGVMQQPTPSVHMTEVAEDEDDPTAAWGEGHRLQLEDFALSIAENRDPFITGEMALEPLKIILAIYRSAKLGGRKVIV